jgi:hypothetical protein
MIALNKNAHGVDFVQENTEKCDSPFCDEGIAESIVPSFREEQSCPINILTSFSKCSMIGEQDKIILTLIIKIWQSWSNQQINIL